MKYQLYSKALGLILSFLTLTSTVKAQTTAQKDSLSSLFKNSLYYALDEANWSNTVSVTTAHLAADATDSTYIAGTLNLYGSSNLPFEASFFGADIHCTFIFSNLSLASGSNLGGVDLTTKIPSFITNSQIVLDSLLIRSNSADSTYSATTFFSNNTAAGTPMSYKGLTFDSFSASVTAIRDATKKTIINADVMGSVTLGGSTGEFEAEVSANHLVNFSGILKPVNFNDLLGGIASNVSADFSSVVSPFLTSLTADSITIQTTDTSGYQVAAYLKSGDQFFAGFGSADSLLTIFLNLKTVSLSNLGTIAGYDIKSYVPNFISNANFGLDSVKYQYDKKDRSYALQAFAGSQAGAGTVLSYQGLSLDTLSTSINISRASANANSLIDASVFGVVSLGTAATGQFSADVVANHFVNFDAILLKPHPINPSDILENIVQSATSDISSLIAPLINFNIDSLSLKSLDTSSYKLTTFLQSGDQFDATFGFAAKDSLINLNLNLKTVTLMNLGMVAGYDLSNYIPNFITNANFGLDSVKYRYNKVLKSYALNVFAGSQAGAGAVLSYQGLSLDTLSTSISISRASANANSLIDASVFGVVSLGTAATGQFSADVVANHFVNFNAILLKPHPIIPSDILKSIVQSATSDISSLIAPLINFNIDSLSLKSLDTSSYKLTTFLQSGDQFDATFGFAAKDSIVNLNLKLKTVKLNELKTVAGFDIRKYIPTYISEANFGLDSVKYQYNKVLKSYALNVFAGSQAGAGAVLSYQGLSLDSLATNINISRGANNNKTNISGSVVGVVNFGNAIQLTLSATADSSKITHLSANATGSFSLGDVINSITETSPDLSSYFSGFSVNDLSLNESESGAYEINVNTSAGNFYVKFGGPGDSIVRLKTQFNNFNTASLSSIITEGFNIGEWVNSLPFSIPNISFDSLTYSYKKKSKDYDLALAFGLGSTGSYAGTSLEDSYAIFSISKKSPAAAVMSATLGGTININSTKFQVEGSVDNQKKWSVSGLLLQSFTMGKVITDILETTGSGLDIGSILPAFFTDITMDSLMLALNADSSIVISSVINGKFIEARRTVNGKYLVGFKFGGVPKLADISSIFSPLDDIGLKDISFAYVNASQTISAIGKVGKNASTGIFDNFKTTSLNQGFNLVAGFNPSLPKPFDKIPNVNLKVIVPQTLNALPQLEGDIELGALGNFAPKNFSLQSAFLSLSTVELPIPSVTYGAGLKFKASLPTSIDFKKLENINFTTDAKITLSAVGGTVNFEFFQDPGDDNIWHHPFGIPNLDLGSLGLLTGYTTDGPIPVLGISGKINFNGMIRGGVGIFDAEIPEMSIISLISGPQISAAEKELNFKKDILNLFLPDNIEIKTLPPFLTEFDLDTLSMTIAPTGGTFFGVTYPQGFSLYSKAHFWGFGGRLSLDIGANGLKGTAKIAPFDFKIDGTRVLKIGAATNPSDSAEVSVDFSTDQITRNGDSLVYIDAAVELLGMKGSANILLGNNGTYFKLHGQIYNLFEADIDAQLKGTFKNPKDFHIRASMSSSFNEYLNAQVQSGLDAATKAEQRAFAKAQSNVSDAQAVIDGNSTITDAFNKASNDVDNAKKEVDRLQGLIDNVRREIDAAQRNRDDAARNRCESCVRIFGKRHCFGAHSDLKCEARVLGDIIKYEAIRDGKKIELEVLKDAKAIADAVLNELERDLKQIGEALQAAEQGLADAALYSAKKTLSGFSKATDGANAAASAISSGVLGGGLFEVKSAQFEGELGSLANSKVSMALNVKFLGKDVSLSFAFDFNDVAGSIQKLVRNLTHNNYNQGKADEFIVGNRP